MQDSVPIAKQLYIYRDKAYFNTYRILRVVSYLRSQALDQLIQRYNQLIAFFQIIVEYSFAIVSQPQYSNTINLQSRLQPITTIYSISILLSNYTTYIYRVNQIADKFELLLPTLVEYLHLDMHSQPIDYLNNVDMSDNNRDGEFDKEGEDSSTLNE